MCVRFFVAVVLVCVTLFSRVDGVMAGEVNASGGKDFLWQVRSKGAAVYLFGSIHMAKPDFYPLAPRVEKSFEKSDTLVMEADPARENDPDLQQRMLRAATYADGDKLRLHVSKETYDLAAREMLRFGLPIENFEGTKPWFLGLTIGVLEFMRLGYDPRYGIERYFAGKAGGKKKLLELESFDYQINLLNGFTDREQELFLLYTIRDVKSVAGELDSLILSWRTGDAKTMESIVMGTVNESPELQPVFEKLYYRRNREMAAGIEKFLRTGKTYFVVVGAAHLVGKQGIVELLRNRGYQVEQE